MRLGGIVLVEAFVTTALDYVAASSATTAKCVNIRLVLLTYLLNILLVALSTV